MMPKNGIYIVQGELNHVVAALRRNNRWSGGQFHQDDDQDPLLASFSQLKETLQNTEDVNDLDVNVFLGPFLEVIRSEDTSGPITGVALSSVNKFLSYGLLDPASESAGPGIESLADAVTHARFVGTDPSSDEVVLMKILQVLRTLLLSPVGVHMTNESVCEIMQSCFRICFEMRLSELLRRTAEQTLIDMVQLLFLRLPQFKEDAKGIICAPHIRKMFKRSGPLSSNRKASRKQAKSPRTNVSTKSPTAPPKVMPGMLTTVSSERDKQKSHSDAELVDEIPIPKSEPMVHSYSDSEEQCATSAIDFKKQRDHLLEEPQPQKMASISEHLNKLGDACDAECTAIANFDPEKMKSLDHGLDTIDSGFRSGSELGKVDACGQMDACGQLEDATAEYDVSRDILKVSVDDVPSIQADNVIAKPDGDVRVDKESDEISNLNSHGVISLHYSEDDVRSLDSIDPDKDDCQDGGEKPRLLSTLSGGDETQSADEHVEHDGSNEYVNKQGVRFTPQEVGKEGHGILVPYGLPCVRELLRFLTSLINPHDRHNTNTMIHIGLSLLTIALESGASHVGHFSSLMNLVKDDLCKNLFALTQCDIHILFSLSMRVCFLLFEALRSQLKFQFEHFFAKLLEILSIDNINAPYEKREMALEYINQLFHIRSLVPELYVNFDCDLHSTNLFEDTCKILSKNAFRPGNLSSVNMLALDALLTVVNEIESHCHVASKGNSCSPPPTTDEKERTISTSSDKTVDGEIGIEDHDDHRPIGLAQSGYAVAMHLLGLVGMTKQRTDEARGEHSLPDIIEVNPPTFEDITKQKRKKKLLWQGIDEFNKKPKRGIEFLQEHGLMTEPLDPVEIVRYFKESPRFDKKVIGDFIGDRKNPKVLEAFVKSFEMKNLRIDEALRSFLESFRLPGESPVIALILESFADVYYKANPDVYKNTDSAFTLAYAVIMLNVDQHNTNVKQQKSMTLDEFRRNLRKTNGGEDFPPTMLEEIYDNIRNNEIVMPSERVGRVKESYEWKVLLRKAGGPDRRFVTVSSSIFNEELFLVVWGPTVAALSYVYDNSSDKAGIQKALQGFKKCAAVSAHYNLSEVFDNLLISMCKFTTLLVTGEPSDNLPVSFGSNIRSQLSARTVFTLAHKHGDILKEGWQNLLVCLLQLFKAKMLPESLTEVEDFVAANGKISIIREKPLPVPKQDSSGLLSSFYAYILANPEVSSRSGQSAEDRQAQEAGINCIKECHPELLITESKFLRADSLLELVKALIIASKPEHSHESTDVAYDEDAAVFFLEFLIKVALQNRDRITMLWQSLREHLSNIIIAAPKASVLVERGVVGLLRLAIRFIRREDIAGQVLITLRILLMMHPRVLQCCSKQIAYGLHELVRTNVSNVTYSRDWITILTLLEVVGAGASPPIVKPGPSLTMISGELYVATPDPRIEPDTGEEYPSPVRSASEEEAADADVSTSEQWLLINKNEDEDIPVNQYDLALNEKLKKHDSRVFIKASQTLGFIIREMAHISTYNVFQCIHALLLFGEACCNGGLKYRMEEPGTGARDVVAKSSPLPKPKKKTHRTSIPKAGKSGKSAGRPSGSGSALSEDEMEISESTSNVYDAITLQLLDLMYTLHSNGSRIIGSMNWDTYQESQKEEIKARWSSKEGIDQLPSTLRGDPDINMSLLWVKCWCPLLQGIARLCCDLRKEIRMSSLTVLQRSLLAQDMQALTASEWESCFNKVLFPMLARLLEIATDDDTTGLEESRMRAATLLCKAFLQHLNTLVSLSTFTALWMTILDFMDKYMHADNSDLLLEAIPESLKNMLLVMSTAGIFEHHDVGSRSENLAQPQHLQADKHSRHYSALWQVTWDRIDCFLPHLKEDLIATRPEVSPPVEPEPMQIPNREEVRTASAPAMLTDPAEHAVCAPTVSEVAARSKCETSDAPPPSCADASPGSGKPLSAPASTQASPVLLGSRSVTLSSPRAASPLLSSEPLSLSFTLHTPLPQVCPMPVIQPVVSLPVSIGPVAAASQPGSVHAIGSPPGSVRAVVSHQETLSTQGIYPSKGSLHPVPILLPAMPSLVSVKEKPPAFASTDLAKHVGDASESPTVESCDVASKQPDKSGYSREMFLSDVRKADSDLSPTKNVTQSAVSSVYDI